MTCILLVFGGKCKGVDSHELKCRKGVGVAKGTIV